MKNRIASLILVFALLMSLCSGAMARDNRITIQSGGAERFTDVPTSHWAYAYINKVVGSGLFKGRTETAFAPSDAMTRAQFVVVMARMEGLGSYERQPTETKPFPDVETTYWAAKPIEWAVQANIVGGFGDGSFKPTSPITRGQFAALIHRYITMKRYVNLRVLDPEPAEFTDASSVSNAFKANVEYARVHGLLTGYSDGTVRASNPITRAAIAAILARFLDLVQESGYTPLLDGPVIDNGGSDSGQSDNGQTDTPPVTTNSGYDDINLNVEGGSHGTTSIASVLRTGQPVDSDDVQRGDRVTISHVPQKGYVAKVKVRDANGRSVAVNRVNANTSWFYAPAALPVTVTVTYELESSGGGGGGGGGGGSTSSSGSGGSTPRPVTTTYTYYQKAEGVVNGANGTVYVAIADAAPTAATIGNYRQDTTASANKTVTTTYAPFTVYAVVTPDVGYELDGAPVVQNGANVLATPTPEMIDGSFVYAINVNSTARLPDSATTVTVTAAFKPVTAEGNTYSIEIQTANKDGSTPVKGAAEYEGEPVYNTAVTVKATPFTNPSNPYENYHVDSVTVYKEDGVTAIGALSENNGVYTFTMPSENIIVKVVFDADTPDRYDYNINLTVDGKGTAVLAAELTGGNEFARITQDVAGVSYTNATGNIENAGPYTVTVEVPRNAEPPSLIAYLASATPAPNYALNDASDVGKEKGKTIVIGGSDTLTAKFDLQHSYGYNLTVIGEGKVTVSFDGQTYDTASPSNFKTKDAQSHTYTATSGNVINGLSSISVSDVTAKDAGWKVASVKIGDATFNADANGTLPAITAQTIPDDTLIDIIVTFLEADAIPVKVSLSSVTGSGTVTMDASLATTSENLEAGAMEDASVLTGLTSGSWYAYSGSVVTVLPVPTDVSMYVVDSVSVTYPGHSESMVDELATDGFSFTVPKIAAGEVSIVVIFKEIERYDITVKAPYQTAVNELKAYTKVLLTDASSVTLSDVLRAQNNGGWTITNPALNVGVSSPVTANGVTNEFYQTPDHLTTLIGVFMSGHSSDIAPTLPADPASLKSVVDSILSDQIDARRPNMEATIQNELNRIALPANLTQNQLVPTGQANSNEQDGSIKEQIINASILKNLLDSGVISRDNIHPWVKVTPVLLTSQETLDPSLTGKSMQSVLVNLLTTHLKSDIEVPVTAEDVQSTLSITAGAMSGHSLPVTVTATADLNRQLTASITKPFTSDAYTDMMVVYVAADMYLKMDNVTLDVIGKTLYELATMVPGSEEYNSLLMYFNANPSLLSLVNNATLAQMCNPYNNVGYKVVTDVAPLSKYSSDAAQMVKTNLVSALSTVDTNIKAQIDSAFSTLNSVAVPIGSILTKDLMDQFLLGEGQYLDQLINRLKNAVKAIGEGENTRQAVENFYNGFIVFNNGESMSATAPISTIGLRTGQGGVSNFAEVNSANPYQLLITIDFEDHWRDSAATDNTPYEKMVSLALNLRDSISQDIQLNGNGVTAKSVVSGIIQARLGDSRIAVNVKKWGVSKSNAQLNAREKKELADLLADLLMSDVNETTMKAAWDKFASKGYTMVDFSVRKAVTGKYADVLASLAGAGNANLQAGFRVELITKN